MARKPKKQPPDSETLEAILEELQEIHALLDSMHADQKKAAARDIFLHDRYLSIRKRSE